MKAKETHRYVLGVHAFHSRGRYGGWLVYCVDYSDGTTKTEKGPLLKDVEAQALGILGDLRHAAMSNEVLERTMSARDFKMRSRRKRR
jgi:hypothetical protein